MPWSTTRRVTSNHDSETLSDTQQRKVRQVRCGSESGDDKLSFTKIIMSRQRPYIDSRSRWARVVVLVDH